MTFLKSFFYCLCLLLIVPSCKEDTTPLPILGKKKEIDGKEVDHFIPEFQYTATDSSQITNADLDDYIYVADFFFTFCPSICPKVTKQMLRIYEEFEDEDRFKLVSYTLDPKRDTPERLGMYGDNLGIDHKKWLFLQGTDQDETYDFAFEHLVPAMQDDEAPGGINHSGSIILIDQQRHIRSFGDGTDPEAIDKLIKDIKKLLKEIEN